MKLIPKDAVLAEIERRKNNLYDSLPDASKVEDGSITISETKYIALESLESFINSLEVTEVAKITQHDIKMYINNKAQKKENSYDK